MRLPLVLAAALAAAPAAAAPPRPEQLPEPLRPWTSWVLAGETEGGCPFLDGGARACVWPGALALSLEAKGGRFVQRLRVYRDTLAPLPGDARHWPLDVTASGKPVPVVDRGGVPVVPLPPGEHLLEGAFAWDAPPEALQVPPGTGLLSLSLGGAPVPFPNRDEQGRLWLQRSAAEEAGDRALEVLVHRRVTDDVPLTVTTRIELRASGKNREELLASALLPGFVPMSVSSPIPARLEPDGKLRVQLRPGTFVVEVLARHQGPAAKLTLAEPDGPWAAEEVWVFEARPHLRQVAVEGAASLDPSQTTLPDGWRHLPAYRLRPGESRALAERQRGDADPAPDRLTLRRSLWLDFDGAGYTIEDELSGTLSRSWRLTMADPTELGRVSVAGRDLLITHREPQGPAGVEVRQGNLSLRAESRLEGHLRELPAVGWAHDLESASATLHLPPGWTLLAASGADDVPATWLRRWTLLDLFLLLVATLAVARLFGKRAGALAFLALLLTIPEADAPAWAWIPPLAFEALARVLPAGKLHLAARILRGVSLAALGLFLVPFAVDEVRVAMYPALEHEHRRMGGAGLEEQAATLFPGKKGEAEPFAAQAPEPEPMLEEKALDLDGKLDDGDLAGLLGSSDVLSRRGPSPQKKQKWKALYRYEYDASAQVQTGPGLPRWTWNQVPIRWSGPVDREQRLSLWLVPPAANTALGFLRVALVALLALVLLGFPGPFWPGFLRRAFARAKPAVPAAAALALLALPGAAGAQVPPPEVLEQLRQRLVEPPPCHPSCADVSRMRLELAPGALRALLDVSAAADAAVALPGGAQAFTPSTVLLDGAPAAGLLRAADGRLWLALPPGAHRVLLEGPLPGREIVSLPLPSRPRRVEVSGDGWSVDGVHEDGRPDENLQLTRRGQVDGSGALLPEAPPPFVRVERELHLGLTWEVQTRVVRLTPPGAAVVLEVPLLPGESVTTQELRTAGGKALVSMGPQATELSWTSALEPRASLALAAPDGLPFVETWRVVASPVWHVEWTGIPTVHDPDPSGDRVPEWRPWPGEAVTLSVVRPEGIPGQTLTIDRSLLTVRPGARSTDAVLELSIRASRGGQHVVKLPAGAELQGVTVGGTRQPIRQEGEKVSLPVVPGAQVVELTWREPRGISPLFRVAAVDAGAPTVNAEVVVQLPADRITLFASGPRMGPAVLYWSLLVILLLVAAGLSRTGLTPLGLGSWLLLAVGLTQLPLVAAALVAGWLLALGLRGDRPGTSPVWFDLRQLGLAVWTLVALGCLFAAIRQGLLGTPEMQVAGNGSSGHLLRWFQDRTGAALPAPLAVSAPLLAYRAAMLGWALWLAWALLGWLRWGFRAFGAGGLWKPLSTPKPVPAVVVEGGPGEAPPAARDPDGLPNPPEVR